jgi:ribosomal protein L32
MHSDSPFGEERKGLLERLRAALATPVPSRRTTHTRRVVRKEHLNLQVPQEHADAVRTALEHWLSEHGVAAAVTTDPAADGKVRFHADLDGESAKKLDLSSDAVQAELQDLLLATMKPS